MTREMWVVQYKTFPEGKWYLYGTANAANLYKDGEEAYKACLKRKRAVPNWQWRTCVVNLEILGDQS